MKHKLIAGLILGAFLVSGIAAYASDVTGAAYYGKVRATNNSTAVSNVSGNFSANTTAWIAAGILNTSATNAAIVSGGGTDTAFQPGTPGYPWLAWFDSVPANASVDATLYTGNVTGGKIRYFPGATGLAVPDSASLELGSNSTVTVRAYVDTTKAGIIASKSGAWELLTDGSGNITAGTPAYTQTANNTFVSSPTYSIFGEQVAAFPPSTISGLTAWLSKTGTPTANITGTIRNSANHTLLATLGTVNAATLTATSAPYVFAGTSYVNPVSQNLTFSVEYADASGVNVVNYHYKNADVVPNAQTQYYTGVWNDNAGLDWTASIIASAFSISGVSSGEYTIASHEDGAHFWLTADSATAHYSSANATAVAVPDNANPIQFGSENVTPYIEYVEVKVGGNQKGYWNWEWNPTLPAVFSDQAGTGNPGVPTFRSTSSADNVTTSLISFAPMTTAVVIGSDNLTWGSSSGGVAPTAANTTYTQASHPGIIGEPFIAAIWPLTGLPEELFWYNWAFLIIIGAGILVYYFFANHGIQALFVKIIIMMALMVFFALPGPNIYGMYVPIYFGFWSFGIIVLSKSYGW